MKKNLLYFIMCLIGYSGLAQSTSLYPVPIYSVTSKQTPSPGYEPSKANDGNTATYYSTPWRGVEIPDELNFALYSKSQSIKQIVYTPYQGGTQGRWTNVTVSYSKKSQPDVFITIVSNLIWANDSSDKVINLATAIQDVAVVRFSVNASQSSYSTCAEMKFYSQETYSPSNGVECTIASTELQMNIDTKVAVVANGSFASEFQSSSENIASSFDGNMSTLYHSRYSGNTQFPVTLNYHFDGNTRIDYLKYYPRTSGWNGWFGNVTIQYNTSSNATFVPLMDYDFAKNGNITVVRFPNGIIPLNIQILVKDGSSGYASCAEMEFYTSIDQNDALIPSGIFANNIYSALAPGVTQAQINAISSTFYRSLAQCLFDGTYNSKYRVQKYEVYKPTNQVHQELKVNGYDVTENATGLYFKQGERIVLFVKNLSAPVNLLVKNFDEGIGGTEKYYALKNGMNVIDITSNGLGYVSYYNSDLTLPDVEINIVNGSVNGYYNLKKNSPQEWPELLQKATYSRIDIVGEFAHVVTRRDYLVANCPYSVVELISKYDEIIKNERLLMGLYKYNRSLKNHQLAFCDANFKGLYAGGRGVNFEPSSGAYDVADYKRLAIWGFAHEFGHNNQVRPDIKWVGMTEVTNNIYSTWCQYKMQNAGKYTRLEQSSSSPASGMPSVAGGDINASIITTKVNNQHFQAVTDNFELLVPFWQLELYYQLAGASRNAPELSFDYPGTYTGVDYARWFATVAEVSRNTNTSGLTNGQLMLNFVKNTCDAVQEDLTDFFKDAGFLKPIDKSIDDYGVGLMQVNQAQIDEAIASIKSKNYQKPVSPVINYISANSMATYKNKLALSGTAGQGVTLNSTAMVVDNTKWSGAVAFEIVDATNKLIHVAIVGTGDISLATTKIYFPTSARTVYAIGYDGKKIQVYPAVLDTTAPVITAPANVAVNTDAAKPTASNVALGVATATDNSGVPTITNNAPATYPIGVTNVVWTATDSAGNTATATQTVTVTDAEVPVITAPANVTVNTDAGMATASNVTLGVATAIDNSGVQPTITNNAPTTYPIGVTNVVWTVRDSAGNTATATQIVTVRDVEAPVITTPADIAVNTDAGIATASNVTLGVATATDNSSVQPTITNNAPTIYPIGVTNVVWTVSDSAGNTATVTQTVTVTDAEAPVISAPSNQVFSFNSNGTYQVPVLTATDNVNVQSIDYTISGATSRNGSNGDASGQFNVGTSTIDWTVTDVHGNTSTATTSVLVKGPQTLVLSSVADSFVRGGIYANDNYGTQPTLPVKNGGTNYVREVYLKFDLSTLPASFEKATLRLNINSSNATASGTTWQASYVSNDNWTETGITWNNKPGASTILQTIPGQSSGWAEWNISDQVLTEVGQDKILTLKIASTAIDPSSNAAFNSKESSDPALQPQLYVNVYSESARMTAKSEVKVQMPGTNGVVLYPNPSTGSSHLTSSLPIQQIRILNANGQQLFIVSGLSTLEYDINVENLPQGLYLVQVKGKDWQKTEQLIKK